MIPWDQNRRLALQMAAFSTECGFGCLCTCDTCVYVYIHACMCVYMTVYGTTRSLAILIMVSQELANTFYNRLEVILSSSSTSYGSFCHKTWIWESDGGRGNDKAEIRISLWTSLWKQHKGILKGFKILRSFLLCYCMKLGVIISALLKAFNLIVSNI